MSLPSRPRRQAGLTLVELMIALTIGLILLGGVLGVYLSSKQTYRARDGLSIVQENGRIALTQLRHGLQWAGFPAFAGIRPVLSADVTLPDESNLAPSSDGASDVLTIAYLPLDADHERDCLGQQGTVPVGGNEIVVSSYFVQDGQLKCRGSGNPAAQTLAEAVDAMQVLYGVDDNGDGYADNYRSAALIDAAGSGGWDRVVSIQVALVVNSVVPVKDLPRNDRFNLLGKAWQSAGADRLARRVFTTTVPLRNRLPLCLDCNGN